jgi:hypothetical protein
MIKIICEYTIVGMDATRANSYIEYSPSSTDIEKKTAEFAKMLIDDQTSKINDKDSAKEILANIGKENI